MYLVRTANPERWERGTGNLEPNVTCKKEWRAEGPVPRVSEDCGR